MRARVHYALWNTASRNGHRMGFTGFEWASLVRRVGRVQNDCYGDFGAMKERNMSGESETLLDLHVVDFNETTGAIIISIDALLLEDPNTHEALTQKAIEILQPTVGAEIKEVLFTARGSAGES
jgi:hypothetical protein